MQINKEEVIPVLRSFVCNSKESAQNRIRAAELLGELGLNEESVEMLLMLARSEEIAGASRLSLAEKLWDRGQKDKTLRAYESITSSNQVAERIRKQAQESIQSISQGGNPVVVEESGILRAQLRVRGLGQDEQGIKAAVDPGESQV
jgi:hypothetical protein